MIDTGTVESSVDGGIERKATFAFMARRLRLRINDCSRGKIAI